MADQADQAGLNGRSVLGGLWSNDAMMLDAAIRLPHAELALVRRK